MTKEVFEEAVDMVVDGDLRENVSVDVVVNGSKIREIGSITRTGTNTFKMKSQDGTMKVFAYSDVLLVSDVGSQDVIVNSACENSMRGDYDNEMEIKRKFEHFLRTNKEAKNEFNRIQNVFDSAIKANSLIEKYRNIKILVDKFYEFYSWNDDVVKFIGCFRNRISESLKVAQTSKEKQKETNANIQHNDDFDLKAYVSKKQKEKEEKKRLREAFDSIKHDSLNKSRANSRDTSIQENEDSPLFGRKLYFPSERNSYMRGTLIVQRQPEEAKEYFLDALQKHENASKALPSLVNVSLRIDSNPCDVCLPLIDFYGSAITNEVAMNLKLSLFLKEKKNEELISLIDSMLPSAMSRTKRIDLCREKAISLMRLEKYDLAIQSLQAYEENLHLAPLCGVAHENAIISHDRLLAMCYYRNGDFIQAKNLAKKVLEYRDKDDVAQAILDNKVTDETNDSMLDSSAEDAEEVMRKSSKEMIFDGVSDKLGIVNLENEIVKKELLNNGIFVGPASEAGRIIEAISHSLSVNEEAKSNQYFAMATMIKQVLERKEPNLPANISEMSYLRYVGYGCLSYGNARLYRMDVENNIDVALYYYRQTMEIFNDIDSTIKWGLKAAVLRYIQSFFFSLEQIKQDAKGFFHRIWDMDEKDFDAEVQKVTQGVLNTGVENFIVGLIDLSISCSKLKRNICDIILSSGCKKEIFQKLEDVYGVKIDYLCQKKDFDEEWENVIGKYTLFLEKFLDCVNETVEYVFSVEILSKNISVMKGFKIASILSETDKNYVLELQKILQLILRYSETMEFSYKADTLQNAHKECEHLIQRIKDYPTYFSYEYLRNSLGLLKNMIHDESLVLYQGSEPVISVKVVDGGCSTNFVDKTIMVPISFVNMVNKQTADNFRVIIKAGSGVSDQSCMDLRKSILVGDGQTKEEMYKFVLDDDVLLTGSFTIVVGVEYSYQKSIDEKNNYVQREFPLTVFLNKDFGFTEIENKFAKFKDGAEVKDPSMFYGRQGDIDRIVAWVHSGVKKSLALYGQTRTGKSSLLYHLRERLQKECQDNIIISLGSIGGILDENNLGDQLDFDSLLYAILGDLHDEIYKNHAELVPVLDSEKLSIDPEIIFSDKGLAQARFGRVMKKLTSVLNSMQQRRYCLIIMVDEFTYIYDYIRRGTLSEGIMKFWKALVQNNDIFTIVVGQDHMMQFVNEERFTNDFGSMDLQQVTYLAEDDAKKLMYEPIMLIDSDGEKINRYKDGALDRLYELTSGSAFLIMKLCAGLVDYLNEIKSPFITQAHIYDFLNKNMSSFEESRYFEPQYNDKSEIGEKGHKLAEKNKKMLRDIAMNSNRKEWTPVSSVVHCEEDREIFDKLVSRDVVEVQNNDRCKIKIALYKEWILAKEGYR